MHLFFRTVWYQWRARSRRRVPLFGVVSTPFRVLPTDLDIFKHMNNGVYLSILDLGRLDMLVRSGFWAIFNQRGWYPVVVAETISFRKSLTLWQRFDVQTRVLGFDDKTVYTEQRFTVDGEIYAQAFVRGRFLKRGGGIVPMAELLDAVGPVPDDVTIPSWLHEWGQTTALPSTKAPAPSEW
ncbi:thioesterase family protein [Agreia sp. COWG]|uniref:thioesterase family protein n=1 Tax=Agreia sp. COWG TaxID=2773266 RepID=UPI001929113D|nr:thioesterase family protein [Agreia sp. COWG]CAD5989761.1 4-hydroxybenzoyl-CoA thioesterase [Agreia sp. COWG]